MVSGCRAFIFIFLRLINLLIEKLAGLMNLDVSDFSEFMVMRGRSGQWFWLDLGIVLEWSEVNGM